MTDSVPKRRRPQRTFTRADLVNAIRKTTPKLNRVQARILLDGVLDEIEMALGTDRLVSLQRFGVFRLLSKAARAGRNPRSGDGEVYMIPAHDAVSFKASPIMRAAMPSPDPRRRGMRRARDDQSEFASREKVVEEV